MAFANKQAIRDFANRKSQRYAKLGYQMEDEVERVLRQAVEDGTFTSVVHHPPNMPYKDFTVTKTADGVEESRSFGITISQKVWSQRRNRGVETQFCFPIGTKPETVIRRVLELFQK